MKTRLPKLLSQKCLFLLSLALVLGGCGGGIIMPGIPIAASEAGGSAFTSDQVESVIIKKFNLAVEAIGRIDSDQSLNGNQSEDESGIFEGCVTISDVSYVYAGTYTLLETKLTTAFTSFSSSEFCESSPSTSVDSMPVVGSLGDSSTGSCALRYDAVELALACSDYRSISGNLLLVHSDSTDTTSVHMQGSVAIDSVDYAVSSFLSATPTSQVGQPLNEGSHVEETGVEESGANDANSGKENSSEANAGSNENKGDDKVFFGK